VNGVEILMAAIESVHQDWIEVAVAGDVDAPDGVVVSIGFRVRSIAGDGVVGIRQGDDPSGQWNGVTDEPLGIAGAIPVLVVEVGDHHGHRQKGPSLVSIDDEPEGVAADQAVGPHDLNLLGRQGCRFHEDAVGNTHLADVVERARLVEMIDELSGDLVGVGTASQFFDQPPAVLCHPLQMPPGLVMTRFGELGQGDEGHVAGLTNLPRLLGDHALQVLAVALVLGEKPPALQGSRHGGGEVFQFERLDQVVVCAFADTLTDRSEILQARDHDHLDIGVQGLEFVQELQAGEARHLDITEHQSRPLLLQYQVQCLLATAGGPARVSQEADLGSEQLPNIGVVIDDQDGLVHRWFQTLSDGIVTGRAVRRQ